MSYRDDVLVALAWLEEQDSKHARVIEKEIERLRAVLTILEESWATAGKATDEFLQGYLEEYDEKGDVRWKG